MDFRKTETAVDVEQLLSKCDPERHPLAIAGLQQRLVAATRREKILKALNQLTPEQLTYLENWVANLPEPTNVSV